MPPEWVSSEHELFEYIIHANTRSINASQQGHLGDGVHVGVIDSISDVPVDVEPAFPRAMRLRPPWKFDPEEPAVPDRHGLQVLHTLTFLVPNATFTLYQICSDGAVRYDAYEDALRAAMDDDVDIVNISLAFSYDWNIEPEHTPVYHIMREFAETGAIPVVAAGNYDPHEDDERPPVQYPGRLSNCVCVAGTETRCPADRADTHADDRRGPWYFDDAGEWIEGTHCGYNGCVDSEPCEAAQEIRPYRLNPRPTDGKPDIMAPAYYPDYLPDRLGASVIFGGTSFSAPLVSGAIARAVGELRQHGHDRPSVEQITASLAATATPLDTGDGRKLNCFGFRQELLRACSG